jgi:hypothetical protein
MMTFTHPALIPLFEDVSMMDADMDVNNTARSLSIQVLRETDEWNTIPDMELAQRIEVRQSQASVLLRTMN